MNNLGKRDWYTCDLGNKHTCLSHGSIQDTENLFCRHFTKGVLLYCTHNCLISSMAAQCSEDVHIIQSPILASFTFYRSTKQENR